MQRLARETSFIYPLHTEVVQRCNRGRCNMSMPIVLIHNTCDERTAKEGITHWHLRHRKVWCKMFSFFLRLQGFQWLWETTAQEIMPSFVAGSLKVLWARTVGMLISHLPLLQLWTTSVSKVGIREVSLAKSLHWQRVVQSSWNVRTKKSVLNWLVTREPQPYKKFSW